MFSLTTYGILAGVLLALLAGSAGYGYSKGHRSAQDACEAQQASGVAAAVSAWQQRAQSQSLADAAARAADQDRQKAATEALEAIQAKWESMRVAVVKMPPQAKCELSPSWIQFYNGATP